MSSSSPTLTGSNNNDDVVNGIVVNDDEKEETLSLPDDLWECLLAGDNYNGNDYTLSIGSSIVAGNNNNEDSGARNTRAKDDNDQDEASLIFHLAHIPRHVLAMYDGHVFSKSAT